MRVLQLIDSLRPGGAEQMAVSYANALAKRIDGSYLCCTRKEGLLKNKIAEEVGYLFLERKHSLDLQPFRNLRKFVKENRINLVQAHGTSWFLAALLKLSLPRLKLVWHDHYGKELQQRKTWPLQVFAGLFDGIISVNEQLKTWSEDDLGAKRVRYFRNFLPASAGIDAAKDYPTLEGRKDGFKIICVANFRPQKDHMNLLRAFQKLLKEEQQVSLHLVGKLAQNVYSKNVLEFIAQNDLESNVFTYGEQENVISLLKQADLGVLSSASEGLPVALLEYGRAGLPVVVTRVGEIPAVVGDNGKLVPPGNPDALASAINIYLQNKQKRSSDAQKLKKAVQQKFSEEAVLPDVIEFFSAMLQEDVKPEKVL